MNTAAPAFHAMTLRELSAWVEAHDCLGFDPVQVDDLDDDEQQTAREELEANADEILLAINSRTS